MAFIYRSPQLRSTYYQFTKPIYHPRDQIIHGSDPSVLPATLHGRSNGGNGWTAPRERRFLEQFYTLDYNWRTTFEVILEANPSGQDGTEVKKAGIKFLEAFRRRLTEQAGPSLWDELAAMAANTENPPPESEASKDVAGHHFLCKGDSGIQFRFTFFLPLTSTESAKSLQKIADTLLGVWESELGTLGEPVIVRHITHPAGWIRTLTQEIGVAFGRNVTLPSRMWDAFGVISRITPEVVDIAWDDLQLRFQLANQMEHSIGLVIRRYPCGVAVWH